MPTANGIPADVIDENVTGQEEPELERFFGKSGVVDRINGSSLLHFDFMERAVTWARFVEKLHKLAIDRVLERMDGERITRPEVRVVLGANYDLRLSMSRDPDLLRYLYATLAGNQYATTRPLEDQFERLEAILTEILAALVIRREVSVSDAEIVEIVPGIVLQRVREYSVPEGFTGLHRLVRDAAYHGSWMRALANIQLGKVFVVWGGASTAGAFWLADKLRETGILVEKAPESLGAGSWWSQIQRKLSRVDFVLYTFDQSDFDPNKSMVKFLELRKAFDHEGQLARQSGLIIPVCLDETDPRGLENDEDLDFGLVHQLTDKHWFRVSPSTGSGFSELHGELINQFRRMRGR